MTDAPRPRKKRWSKRAVRATAWTAGAAAFFSALGAFGAAATPVAADQASSAPNRQKIIIRRVVKRIVIVDAAPPAPVRVVSPGGSGTAPAAAPAPAPSTGGS